MALKPVTVTQLNDYISRVLMTDPLLTNISVTGEISNLKYHSSGHVYFSINDENSKINCFFPATYVRNLKYELADGLQVVINGYINVYKKGGTYTLFVRNVTVSGEGSLAASFALLKERLQSEGLFDADKKKPLPAFPHKLGIVTSETGAAVHDIIKIITERNNVVDITIFPVQVQGLGAAEDIAGMISYINSEAEFKDIDLLIVGRGGGSAEDLWAFNEEILARAIYSSDIPIISAVGHETDFSISDFVADRRAETPTAAAEMAVPDIREIKIRMEKYKKDLLMQLNNKLLIAGLYTENLLNDMKSYLDSMISRYENDMEKCRLILEENNPESVLSKGYSIVENSSAELVTSVKDFNDGKGYRITFRDGSVIFDASCTKVEKHKKKI